MIESETCELERRHIREDICRKYGYGVGRYKGADVQVAPYYNAAGELVAQKVRTASKDFTVLGDGKQIGKLLFGANLWKSGGRRVVVTEGEIDALSVAQALGGTWPVVSIPNGAAGAAKSIKANLEWLESYEEVVFWFDNDEPGRKASVECAELLTPGRAKIIQVEAKDANDLLKAGKTKEIVNAVWEAKVYRPDGIINGADVWDDISHTVDAGLAYPWPGLNRITHGARPGEIVTLTAGSGIGKSAICGEIAYHLAITHGQPVGYIALEENIRRSARRFVGIHLSKPIHLPGVNIPPDELRRGFDETLGTKRFYLFDHWGSLDVENLMAKLRYLVKACGVKWAFLDHLSIVVSGADLEVDERRMIDNTMTRLRSFAEETEVGLFVVSHLKRVQGNKGHEDGIETSLSHLRGSQAIAQLSDLVVGGERDQQAEDDTERNTTTIRVLKNRYSGETGVACSLRYNPDTGRLREEDDPAEDDIPF
jgi:twinkle protein